MKGKNENTQLLYRGWKGSYPQLYTRFTNGRKIDGLSVLENIENNQMDSLMVKVWEKKVMEVYFRKHNRIYYVVQDDENIYLLFAGRKQKNKTEKKDARLIRYRAKELGKVLNKKFV